MVKYSHNVLTYNLVNSKEITKKRMFDCCQIPYSEEFINKKVAGKLKWDIATYFQINTRV